MTMEDLCARCGHTRRSHCGFNDGCFAPVRDTMCGCSRFEKSEMKTENTEPHKGPSDSKPMQAAQVVNPRPTNLPEVDYRELLKQYIRYVDACASKDFLCDTSYRRSANIFTDVEWYELQAVNAQRIEEDELICKCGHERWSHGVACGCCGNDEDCLCVEFERGE